MQTVKRPGKKQLTFWIEENLADAFAELAAGSHRSGSQLFRDWILERSKQLGTGVGSLKNPRILGGRKQKPEDPPQNQKKAQ